MQFLVRMLEKYVPTFKIVRNGKNEIKKKYILEKAYYCNQFTLRKVEFLMFTYPHLYMVKPPLVTVYHQTAI